MKNNLLIAGLIMAALIVIFVPTACSIGTTQPITTTTTTTTSGPVPIIPLVTSGVPGGPPGNSSMPGFLENLPSGQEVGISVSGSGSVFATPDICNLNIGVQSHEATVADAQSKAAQAMSQIMSTLKENNIADKDIRTEQFSINPVYQYNNQTNTSTISGYEVTNIVTVKIRNLTNVSTIIDAVAAAGGDLTIINGISFSVDNPTTYYTQARQLAIDDAKAKAEQLASLNGVTLGNPIYISENAVTPQTTPMYNIAAVAVPAPATSISSGQSEITINIQIVYSIS